VNKKEFFKELKSRLKNLSKEDREEILEDYEEHFNIGLKKGRTEAKLIKSLGSPKAIAKQESANLLIKKAEEKASFSNVTRAILAIIGLGFFNLVFVSGIFFGLIGVLIGVYAITISFVVTGIFLIFAPLIPAFTNLLAFGITSLATIFAGIGCLCIGLLMLMGSYYTSKGFFSLVIKYLKLNIKIIRGN
jgi:uncharacterized membrane protein